MLVTQFIRTPEENFADLPGFDYEPPYHTWHHAGVPGLGRAAQAHNYQVLLGWRIG
jgi:hypothetical protein